MSSLSFFTLLGFLSLPLFAMSSLEQHSLDEQGVAVICASETTSEIEDAATRLNRKLASLHGRMQISAPVVLPATGLRPGFNLCVTVNKK